MHHNMTSLMSSMSPIVQQAPHPQIAYQSLSPQPQQVYQQGLLQISSQQPQYVQQPALSISSQPQSHSPTVLQPQQQQQTQHAPSQTSSITTQPQLQYPHSIYQQTQSLQSPISYASQHAPLLQQPVQPPSTGKLSHGQQVIQQQPRQDPHDHRFQELEKQRTQDIEKMNQAGAELNKRLRDLEQSEARVQSDHEAKDREVRQLQEQLAAAERQRRQDAERNSQQLTELLRSHATSPSAQTPALDTNALRRVIQETQVQQLSAQDIERVIEEQVSKRLSGMATKADIQNAGAQMQHALSRVPTGLNEQQVQQAVKRELNNVMQDVANRVNQQRRIAGQTSQGHVQTEFVIEELPEEITVIQSDNEATPQRMPLSAGGHYTGPIFAPEPVQHGNAYPTSAYGEVQMMTSQRPAAAGQSLGGSQYAAIEPGPPRQSIVPTSQAHMPTSSNPKIARHIAAIAPSPLASNVPGNALAPLEVAKPQERLEAASAQMQQITGAGNQRQLEAPPLTTTAHPTRGQELVRQGRDLERQIPRG